MTRNNNETKGANSSPRPSGGGKIHLLKEGEVCERASLARGRLWRMVREGTFPAPIEIARRRVAWYEHEVQAWILNPII